MATPTPDSRTKTALVTGGASGIGAACCRELARAGYAVGIHFHRSEAAAEALHAELAGSWLVRADLADPEQVEALGREIQQRSPLDLFVSNAGVVHQRPFLLSSLDDYERVFAVNLTAAWRLAKRVAGRMVRARCGSITFVSSIVGERGNQMQSVYAMTKAALENLARSLAVELAPYGIRVNAVAPGLIDTPLLEAVHAATLQEIVARIPLARMGRAEEVARVVRFLADEGTYITGAVIPVNGGLHLG
ncbi:MAG: SDR family oxidoreductase [Planctomycetes bacterium]|nr:SDR family oxidoreductase [Planctomycetota bacterium]